MIHPTPSHTLFFGSKESAEIALTKINHKGFASIVLRQDEAKDKWSIVLVLDVNRSKKR